MSAISLEIGESEEDGGGGVRGKQRLKFYQQGLHSGLMDPEVTKTELSGQTTGWVACIEGWSSHRNGPGQWGRRAFCLEDLGRVLGFSTRCKRVRQRCRWTV